MTGPMLSWPNELLLLGVLLLISCLFALRSGEFFERASKVPFAMAAARFSASASDNQGKVTAHPKPELPPIERPVTVYLAGGMRSSWQERAVGALGEYARLLDPREHQLDAPTEFTRVDLDAIDASQMVFAYLETSNPGGYALAFELGYAKARGQIVVLVDEKRSDPEHERAMRLVAAAVDVQAGTLDEGLEKARQILRFKSGRRH